MYTVLPFDTIFFIEKGHLRQAGLHSLGVIATLVLFYTAPSSGSCFFPLLFTTYIAMLGKANTSEIIRGL